MKAIRVHAFGGPEVLTLEDAQPVVARDGEVVVRLHATGVNPVDTYVRAGTYARKPSLPYTPGTDGAGVIEQAGSGVTAVKPGDRVYVAALLAGRSTGTYAESVACDAASVRPLPDRLSFAQGAGVGVPYATAWRGLFQRARAEAGESVLVHGASGGVGLAAVQMARAAGLKVIGSAGTPLGRDAVRAQGAHHVVDHTRGDYLQEVLDLTGARGVDVVLEMLANENLERDFSVLAMRGRVVVIGSRGTIEFSPRVTMAREAAILGMALWNLTPAENSSIHDGLAAGLAGGWLTPVVGREIPLGEAARAHREVLERGALGKIVLVP